MVKIDLESIGHDDSIILKEKLLILLKETKEKLIEQEKINRERSLS